MSILEQITGFPERILQSFRKTNSSVVGIDIGPSSIKVVQVRKEKGRAVLETYGELALGPYADLEVGQATNLPSEKLAEALTDVMREAHVTTKNAAFSIPLVSSLVSIISLPSVPESELKDMVPIEARKYIPVPISEIMLDWWVIPPRDSEATELEKQVGGDKAKPEDPNRIEILLVAIHNSVIGNYERIAEQAGLTIGFLEIESFSAIRSLVPLGLTPFLIFDMGANTTNISIVENGVVYRSHVINRGSQDITTALSRSQNMTILQAEEKKREFGLVESSDGENIVAGSARLIIEGILFDVNRILLDYEKKQHKAIGKVILSGGGTLIKGMLPLAEKNFETDVVYGNPFTKVETPAFLEPVLKEIGPSFAIALGVALRRVQEIE